jgi:hypothetical protein
MRVLLANIAVKLADGNIGWSIQKAVAKETPKKFIIDKSDAENNYTGYSSHLDKIILEQMEGANRLWLSKPDFEVEIRLEKWCRWEDRATVARELWSTLTDMMAKISGSAFRVVTDNMVAMDTILDKL